MNIEQTPFLANLVKVEPAVATLKAMLSSLKGIKGSQDFGKNTAVVNVSKPALCLLWKNSSNKQLKIKCPTLIY